MHFGSFPLPRGGEWMGMRGPEGGIAPYPPCWLAHHHFTLTLTLRGGRTDVSIPIEQMEKSRLLPGRAPAPSLLLPQAVPRAGRLSAPAKPSAAPSRCGNCFMRLPGAQGPPGRDPGRGRFACGCKCFPCKHDLCQSISPYVCRGVAT